ncbi:ATP-binding protein [Aquabacterium sp.]|uniref:ATP-binding protein n=1 Tax=Aquabacterium sp. TaxID=1872578 RepID=UPI003D6CB5FC
MSRLKRWLGDTLFMRLFILMWVALVVSHVVAYSVVTSWHEAPSHAQDEPGPGLPTFPSLPPTPGLEAGPGMRPGGPAGPGGGPMPNRGPRPPMAPGGLTREPPDEQPLPWRGDAQPGAQAASLPPPSHSRAGMLVVDYGIRFLIIGLAAWLGARWLSRPMHTLASASRELTALLGQDPQRLPKLDESRGTTEVRETARVFNDMAQRLSDQFKARGLMLAALSHDLRTPLTRMRMRMVSLPEDPLLDRCVNDIREMNELIDSALQMFRDAGANEPVQNADVCSVVQSLTDDLIEQGQAVTFQGDTAVVKCRPVLLRRVVSNLVGNALRYGQRADVSVRWQGQQVRIVVDDAGPGIPPEQLDAVFQPFYRVESSRNRHTGGTGLGLYIARDLITRQGGTLTLRNRPEGGLRAEVLLPRTHVSGSTQSR